MCQSSYQAESINTNGPALPGLQAQLPPPNSLPQLALPLGDACPTTLQPVFIPHLEPTKRAGSVLLICAGHKPPDIQEMEPRGRQKLQRVTGCEISVQKEVWILPVVTLLPGAFCILTA